MKPGLPVKSLAIAAAVFVTAGTAAPVWAHGGHERSRQSHGGREKPSASAEKAFSSCKPRLNRMSNDGKHLLRDALRSAMDALETAASADPPADAEALAALLESGMAAIQAAADQSKAELEARGDELIQRMTDKGATEAQIERAKMYLARAAERIDSRAAEAAQELQDRYDDIVAPDDDTESGDDSGDCDESGDDSST